MTRIELDESLVTGNPTVDEQHRRLFEMFRVLEEHSSSAMDREALDEMLLALIDYTTEHFGAEQSLMVAHRFPADEMLAHVEQHSRLTERTREVVLQHREVAGDTAPMLAALLRDWLANHIREWDLRLAAHLHAVATEAK